MSRRARALAFAFGALLAAALAAAIADRYGARVADRYGALQPVVVARRQLRGGRPIDPALAASGLEVRRVPARFAPPGALRSPAAAVGLVPALPVPAGAYLSSAQLRPPRRRGAVATGLGHGRQPVQIEVSGAEALAAAGAAGGRRVDVVVTTEPAGPGGGHAYVAAAAVPLLGLAAGGPQPDGTVAATLGLTRHQALRLIAAESFARRLTLLPRG